MWKRQMEIPGLTGRTREKNSMGLLKTDCSSSITHILIYLTALISFTTLCRSLALERIWSSQWESLLTVRVTHGG